MSTLEVFRPALAKEGLSREAISRIYGATLKAGGKTRKSGKSKTNQGPRGGFNSHIRDELNPPFAG